MGLTPALLKFGLNIFGSYLGTVIKVNYFSKDWGANNLLCGPNNNLKMNAVTDITKFSAGKILNQALY